MFDLRLPQSITDIPGRFIELCWDEDETPVRTLPPPMTAAERLARKRAAGRAYYARNREQILARGKARRRSSPRVKQTPEQRAAQKAHYWATNRERINARRAKVKA